MRRGLLNGGKFLCSDVGVDMEIWGLFTQMKDMPSLPVEHALEIVERAMEGAIDLDREFNLYGYDYAIKTGKKRKAIKNLSTETFIDFSGCRDDKQNDVESKGGVSIDVVSFQADALSDARNEFECLLDNAELQCAIESIKSLNEDFMVEYSIDLISLIRKAVKGIPQAVLKLKGVCDEMPCVAEQVKVVLSSGVSVEECFSAE